MAKMAFSLEEAPCGPTTSVGGPTTSVGGSTGFFTFWRRCCVIQFSSQTPPVTFRYELRIDQAQ